MHRLEEGFGKLVGGAVRYLELSVPKFSGMYRMRDVPAGKGNGFYSWVAGAWSTWIVSLLLPLASWS